MLDLDGAAAGEALRVLEHEAAGGDRPGVDADVALDDDLGGGLLAGGHEGDGRGGEEGESELGHFRFVCVCGGRSGERTARRRRGRRVRRVGQLKRRALAANL